MKIIIFGAGSKGQELYKKLQNANNSLLVVDNDCRKQGNLKICDGNVRNPTVLGTEDFDKVIVATMTDLDAVVEQILLAGVPLSKIDTSYVAIAREGREIFVRQLGDYFSENNIKGSVAEVGVYKGDFAQIINDTFSRRRFYLFDTFEGFPKEDCDVEIQRQYSEAFFFDLNDTSIELVKTKLKYPQNAIFRKGYFPTTAEDIDENFCFVNLDLDLFAPTYKGLEKFYPLMVKGGVILVHDFFNNNYTGVRAAVNQFLAKTSASAVPIGDGVSIAIIK